jgi:glucuronoarabinoxylan endo-1,4-beta-xylanase
MIYIERKKLIVLSISFVFLTLANLHAANINLVTNPGFENGTTGWTARAGGTFAETTNPVRTGTNAGRSYSRTQTYQGIKQSLLEKVQFGTAYTISAYLRTSTSASSPVKISIERADGSGTTYSSVASGNATSNGWTKLQGSFTFSYTGTITTLDLYFEGPASGVELYVDDANVLGPSPSSSQEASAQLDPSTRYQILEGFGGAGAWYEQSVLNYSEPTRTNLYNTLFRNLGLDIYRVRNTYGIDNGYITRSATIINAAENSLGHSIRVLNSSWGPPAYLKSNNDFENGGTLIKDANGNYEYAQFAQWWRDSLTAWSNAGVNIYYLSMQNEPGWAADWATCLWDPTENSTRAGYKQGFAALYTNLNTMPNRPKLLAPENQSLSSTGNYINALNTTDKANIYGYSHHLYDGDPNRPDGLVSAMTAFKNQYSDKPVFQTEYSSGYVVNWENAMYLAMLINNCLTVENVSAYFYWDLFWASPNGLVSLTTPNYTINPVYYAFKHFSYFTDPNWQRIALSADSSSLRTSAFINPDNNEVSIIVINTSLTVDYNTTFNLGNFEIEAGDIYRSSASENFVLAGAYNGKVLFPKNSITTIVLDGALIPQNCQQVQDFGYALLSDINGDCLVNYKDLYAISEHWLKTDCEETDNCGGADLQPADGTVDFMDFKDLAQQWMQCNDPQNANCSQNW